MGRSRIIDALDDFTDAFGPPLVFIGVMGAAIWGLASLCIWLNGKSCAASGEKMGIEVSYSGWTGCMIRVSGSWLPWSEVIPVERDGKIVFAPKPVVRIGQ